MSGSPSAISMRRFGSTSGGWDCGRQDGSASRVEKFLQDRGEAVHHVAYATDDVRASLEKAGAAGAQLLDEVARAGAHGTRIGFVHPKSVCGVLTEFVEADGHAGA